MKKLFKSLLAVLMCLTMLAPNTVSAKADDNTAEMNQYSERAESSTTTSDISDKVNPETATYYHDKIVIDSKFVNSTWTYGETIKIPFTMFTFKGGEKWTVRVYDSSKNIVGEATGYFRTTKYLQYNYTINVSPDVYETSGTFYVRFWSQYYETTQEYNIYNTYYPFYIKSAVNATSITLDKSKLELDLGQTEKLNATISPSNATQTTVTWSSSDTSVATVDSNGNVTAVAEGKATITARTSNGLTATCTVDVYDSQGFPFRDVPKSKWFYNTVKEAYEAGLMSGTSATTFSPNDNMTRGMIVTVMHRIAGKPAATYNGRFPDVKASSYCATAVEWAASNKVVSGYSDGKFGPNDNITRQDVCVILHNYAKAVGLNVDNDTDLTQFGDYRNVSGYAKEAVKWAISVGIISGSTNPETGIKEIKPKDNATRAECAKMLLQASKIY